MRKIIISLAVILATAISVNAKETSKSNVGWYAGGDLGFALIASNGNTFFTWEVAPELGYDINDNHEVGFAFAMGGNNLGTAFCFDFKPYYRWNFYKIGELKFFLDSVVSLGASIYGKNSGLESGSSAFAWGVAFAPGLSYKFSDRWSIIAHVASIGVRGTMYETTFDMSVITGPTVGVKYNF